MLLKELFVQAVANTLPMFGLSAELLEISESSVLASAEEVNVHVGFTDGIRGNAVIGFSKETALSIVSIMMGGGDPGEFGFMAKSALGELGNMLVGGAMMAAGGATVINLSAPTIVAGEGMFIVMSRVASTKLVFDLSGRRMVIVFTQE